jgi:hypothetical protein
MQPLRDSAGSPALYLPCSVFSFATAKEILSLFGAARRLNVLSARKSDALKPA